MAEENTQFISISIEASSNYSDAENLKRDLKLLKDLPVPEEFSNRLIDINEGDLSDSTLMFSDQPASELDVLAPNIIAISVSEEYEIRLHAYFSLEFLTDIQEAFDRALSIFQKMKISKFNSEIEMQAPFKELNLPFDTDSDLDLVGVRFNMDDMNFILQEEDKKTAIRQSLNNSFSLRKEDENPSQFIEDQIDMIKGVLKRFER